jgi:hypothetical protein
VGYVEEKANTTHLGRFALEHIDLVEKEDDQGAKEPPQGNDAPEQDQ